MKLNEFTEKIINNENFSIIKYGDGEINCMRNLKGNNCDGHNYSEELGKFLISSLINLSRKENVYFPDWYSNAPKIGDNYNFLNELILENNLNIKFINPFEILLTGWGNLENDNLLNFYKSIKISKKNKIFIGPIRLNGVIKTLNIDKNIEIPLINAFDDFEIIFEKVKKTLKSDSIVILCVGMMSPYLSNEILSVENNVTILDMGNAFDPIFYGTTRHGGQASFFEARNYFKEILE